MFILVCGCKITVKAIKNQTFCQKNYANAYVLLLN